ncbi:MAG: hypothetical protein R3Y06_09765 [Faecalibacterium sp.]
MRVKMNFILFACLGALVLGCSGCSITTPDVEDLLRAPVLSRDYSDIQTALMNRFDSTVQLKYPTEGTLLSPFALGDWDGDGAQDAVVLFTLEDSSMVLVGILKQDENAEWQVVGTANGLSDTVISMEFASLQSGQAQQIVATFQAQGAQYLAVYAYQDGWLNTVFQQPCSQYLIEDITGNGTDDMILISSNDTGAVQMELLTYSADGFTQTLIPSFNEEPFTSYLNISTSAVGASRRYLVIDGFVGEGQTTVVSEMLWYNAASGTFECPSLASSQDLYADSKRYSANLISYDIDGDGAVEVPVQYATDAGVVNNVLGSPITMIGWMDYTTYSSLTSFGIFDDEYNYYLALPEEVRGNLLLIDGENEGEVEVRNLAGDVLYFTLRVVNFDQVESDWHQIGTVASKQIQVKIGEEASDFLSAYILSKAVYLL